MLEGRQRLQIAATALGNGTPVDTGGAGKDHAFYIETTNAVVSAGGVTLETARTATFTGVWQAITPEILPVQNAVLLVSYTGVLLAVRARVSTAITGGAAVTVEYASNS
jgi:hypothetical protein